MNLVQVLEERAAANPGHLALVDGAGEHARRIGFGELAARVRGAAEDLGLRGVGRGDHVLLLHPVSVDLYVALLAAMRIGAVAMLVDPGSGLAGFRRALRRVRPVAWSGRGKGVMVKCLVPALWRVKRVRPEATEASGRLAPPEAVDDDAPALLTFTSGSTGVAKAAVRSHGFLLTQNRVLGRAIELEPGEVDLVTLPVFALANLAHGVTSVLASTESAVLSRQLVDERVTRGAVSPANLCEWLDEGVPLGRMEKIFTGGGPVFPPLLQRLRQAQGDEGKTCVVVYGSTEAEPIAHLDASEIRSEDLEEMQGGSGLLTGRPVPEIQLAIFPDQWGRPIPPMDAAAFAAACLRAGEAGEIVVSGEHVLSGYLGGVGDEETKFRVDGSVWHRTGDAGRIDAEGRLWLLGRCAAVVRDERGELHPFAIETMLSFLPRIRRSAVLALGGRRLLAIETEDGSVPDGFSLPDGIDEIRPLLHIPVDHRHRSKIDYPRLRQVLGRGA